MRSSLVGLVVASVVAVASGAGAQVRPAAKMADPGALIAVSMSSRAGVLLDEVPAAIRDRVAASYLARPAAFWEARARMQVGTTLYRLTYRNFYYSNKGQLPMPPETGWQITTRPPVRETVDGHDVVLADYTFQSTLLSDLHSVAESEPALTKAGHKWDERFVLPVDPDLLFERTGYACMNESDFPPNSVDTENARLFYDDTCKGGSTDCHVTLPYPKQSCVAALKARIGRLSTKVHFERLRWNDALADAVRVGSPNPPGADLAVIGAGLDNHRLIYRYIEPGSCAVAEGCVGAAGWRRLLQFDASVQNLGAKPVHIGDVSPGSAVVQHNMFEFSACHEHMHFTHYGRFSYDTGTEHLGAKRAFCLESVTRYSNNEATPLTHPYGCAYQGIEAGWGDDYIAGIDCQWIDVTAVDTASGPVTAPLTFEVNPDNFLCEGTPVIDIHGDFVFEPTSFTTETGARVDRIACDATPGYAANNIQSRSVLIPVAGSFVTEPCTRGQLGPLRNCGFRKQDDASVCRPGREVKLRCTVGQGAAPQTIRVCDHSAMLATGIACTQREALANVSVAAAGTNVTFVCPAARDASEPGGSYSVFTAPTFDEDPPQVVRCVPR